MSIQWALRMAAHPAEAQEFRYSLEVIRPTMTDPKESRDTKRKVLNTMVETLSESTFKLAPVAEQIMEIINMKEDVCKEYKDTEAHVNGVLSWLPRMKMHRERLKNKIEKQRKRYGLKI